jgi:hypothetical protein
MTTQKQAAANRRNAQESTGPRTAEGKARSRLNALKWGLSSLSGIGLLPTENRAEYDRFRDEHLVDLDPVGAMEEQLATEVIDCDWGIRRAAKIEVGILAHGVADADERYLTGLRRMVEVTRSTAERRAAGILDPEEVVKITDPDMHEVLTKLIGEALKLRETDAARLAGGFIEDATGPDSLGKLGRYRTMLFRHRNQALAMLRELQAARSEETKARA